MDIEKLAKGIEPDPMDTRFVMKTNNCEVEAKVIDGSFYFSHGWIKKVSDWKTVFKHMPEVLKLYPDFINNVSGEDNDRIYIAATIDCENARNAASIANGLPTSHKLWFLKGTKISFSEWMNSQPLESNKTAKSYADKGIQKKLEAIENYRKSKAHMKILFDGKDPDRNSHILEFQQHDYVASFLKVSWHDVQDKPEGADGAMDFVCPIHNIVYGQMKSSQIKVSKSGSGLTLSNLGGAMWCKQNEAEPRERLYRCDALIYTGIHEETFEPIFSIFIHGEPMKKLHALIKAEQDKAMERFESRRKEGKNIGHEGVVIRVKDIFPLLDDTDVSILYKGKILNKAEFLQFVS